MWYFAWILGVGLAVLWPSSMLYGWKLMMSWIIDALLTEIGAVQWTKKFC